VDAPINIPGDENLSEVLIVARLLPYKNVDLALEVARCMPDTRFRIIGDGPLFDSLNETAPSNVTLLGSVDEHTLWREYASTKVHLALSYEDFGITPLEAAAAGKPTVARGSGGYVDTITPTTGVLIDERELTATSIADELRRALTRDWDRTQLTLQASKFSRSAHWAGLQAQIAGL
jgi:glycosyltransferase involved in cell wall biosynthesis